jgi:GTP pyrophosphokinase
MDSLPIIEEQAIFRKIYRRLLQSVGDTVLPDDISKVKQYIRAAGKNAYGTDVYGLNILNRTLHTAIIVVEEIGLKRTSVLSVLLSHLVRNNHCRINEIEKDFGEDAAGIIRGLVKTHQLYDKKAAIDNENFRTLLLSFAEDVRVILIMIAERLYLMRMAKYFTNEEHRLQIAAEASYLYAPLSHRLGLYKIKSELEDLSLKFQDREMYDFIARKINETKRSRDKYIAEFIAPIEKKLQELGLQFDIKGRTKSIHSIRSKLLKQQIEFENIYDLFAIRVILDTPEEKEKAECWQVYSVVTDMYQPNPQRMKDWLSIPKSNGYESLHTTVMGPEGRWVEVQIRSKRMDEIAEKGLAAHWKYKGLKDSGLDNWLNNVRAVLENKDSTPADLIHDFKMDLYDQEIFVFTPKGDLFKLPQNATVLDFAFAIHTKIGSKCVSARINGKNVSIKHKLQSGDQVDIQTSPNQTPKQDWLSFVVTGKARVKIKQSLKEQSVKQVELAKELLHRRFKNRKIEEDEPVLMRLIKKKGYKNVTDFFADIATEHLDVNSIIDQYLELEKKEQETAEHIDRSVENYRAPAPVDAVPSQEDVLVIDKDLTDIDYTLAKCCNPIYGDEIFGFVSSQGIKIHRLNCPNAPAMFKKYGYRIVQSRWAGKLGANYPVTLKVVGHDDIGIVTNITSVIAKENGMMLRSITVDSSDGLFQGTLTVMLSDTSVMNTLIKKIKAIKGVKQVSRY